MIDFVLQGAGRLVLDSACRYGRLVAVVLAFVAVAAGYHRMWATAEVLLSAAVILYVLSLAWLLRSALLHPESASSTKNERRQR